MEPAKTTVKTYLSWKSSDDTNECVTKVNPKDGLTLVGVPIKKIRAKARAQSGTCSIGSTACPYKNQEMCDHVGCGRYYLLTETDYLANVLAGNIT